MGHEICPELMYRVLAAELMTWSMACIAKLKVIKNFADFCRRVYTKQRRQMCDFVVPVNG